MIRCGELCKHCGRHCGKDYKDGFTLVECPVCDGVGYRMFKQIKIPCPSCEDGKFKLNECPREFIGREMTVAINLAANSGKGDWPIAGGLLEQSAWFMSLRQTLLAEQNKIEAEAAK